MAVRVGLDLDRFTALRHHAVATVTAPAAMEVRGSGALTCLQGLLTADLAQPGDQSLTYGAMLTPKGAIIVDLWVLREGERFLLLTGPDAREPLTELLKKSLPPRLARVADRTGAVSALWLHGAEAPAALARAGLPLSELAGRVEGAGEDDARLLIAHPQSAAPFRGLLVGSPGATSAAAVRLLEAGAVMGDEADHEAARILAGWPARGSEIGQKTLVQEVRYDEIGGVSYTKGCYTGQETVARLHFRGHTNRDLRGLLWAGTGELTGETLLGEDGREAGEVCSVLALPDRRLGLALIRREFATGSRLTAGGCEAEIVALPFDSSLLPA
jgi:folate-binding protein YgfZ